MGVQCTTNVNVNLMKANLDSTRCEGSTKRIGSPYASSIDPQPTDTRRPKRGARCMN